MERRKEDQRWSDNPALIRALVALAVVLMLVTAVATTVTWISQSRIEDNSANIHDLAAESDQRIDQTCILFEGLAQTRAQQLRDTYVYLEQLRPHEKDATINRFILANLSNTERDARAAVAPKYCDAKGVGMPEPNVLIPPRPPGLRAP